jgi:hypothetical protein
VKIQVAFYKGEGNFFNKVVRWWTDSIYSHAEIVLPDGYTWVGISPFIKSKVDERKKIMFVHKEWDFIDIDITENQYNIIMEFIEDTKGQGYDWIGMLLSQFLPCKIKHKKRWYCSEWISYALRIACIIDWRKIRIYERKDLSPEVLYQLLIKPNNEI